jgi:hypothetical protein
VLALGLEEELDPVELDLADQELADGGGLLGGEAAGAAVGDGAVGVEGAEVDPGGHVAGLELEADAGRGQGAPADLVFQRVVAEQAEVAGAGPGGDAPGDRVVEPQGALAGQPVEVGGVGLGELGAPLGGPVAAEAVHHQQERLLAFGPCHLGHNGLGGERHRRLRTSGYWPSSLRGARAGAKRQHVTTPRNPVRLTGGRTRLLPADWAPGGHRRPEELPRLPENDSRKPRPTTRRPLGPRRVAVGLRVPTVRDAPSGPVSPSSGNSDPDFPVLPRRPLGAKRNLEGGKVAVKAPSSLVRRVCPARDG